MPAQISTCFIYTKQNPDRISLSFFLLLLAMPRVLDCVIPSPSSYIKAVSIPSRPQKFNCEAANVWGGGDASKRQVTFIYFLNHVTKIPK